MIEQKTTSAAGSKMRPSRATCRSNTGSAKVVVATPLGANQPMNSRVG
jgi:hypothetical protein